MDVLRKELTAFYESQNLADEKLDYKLLAECRRRVEVAVGVENDCRVITDAAADHCFIFGGSFSYLIGLSDGCWFAEEMDSSDEDVIYKRIHPEDLVDKRMLEYEFFKYIDTLPNSLKTNYKATCSIRIRNRNGQYIRVNNSTRVMRLSPNGKVWIILCGYELAPEQQASEGIEPRIINFVTGEITDVQLSERRAHILTDREKEILRLIKEGKPSKQIAELLKISVHTVSRHRQNILEKLSVGNSVEAIMAATLMKLL